MSSRSLEEKVDKEQTISEYMRKILELSNPEATEEIMEKTPMRYAKALSEFTEGYYQNIPKLLNDAIFECENYFEPILVKEISFVSTCEHHLLPFFGDAAICYIPNQKILGLSKFPRLVQSVAKKFQLQERLTRDIAEILNEYLAPKGIIVMMKAVHSCMCLRGVKSWNSETRTVYKTGVFNEKENFQMFMDLLNAK